MRFTDKVCIVSGGGSGIGRGACERFAAEGGQLRVATSPHGKGLVTKLAARSFAGRPALMYTTSAPRQPRQQGGLSTPLRRQ
jgi:NAD(P)-dependent dehydrogenase (short-subunit alcohol dehydrogenase family)